MTVRVTIMGTRPKPASNGNGFDGRLSNWSHIGVTIRQDEEARSAATDSATWPIWKVSRDYFLPALFAAQYAFNLADNFALAAGLMVFFFALAALTEGVAGLLP
jgi:hypothetical protein